MKIQISCWECQKEGNKKDEGRKVPYVPSYPYWEYPMIELEKWPYFEMTCEKGHKQRLTWSLELYELLFQQATYCIFDGYYREAIGTYNSALERYFEYVIEMISLEYNHDMNFNEIWKRVRNQSERQLGGFYFLWAAHFKENPIFLDEDMVKLRNSVVHKGELVSKTKAIEFGKYVFNYIKQCEEKMNTSFGEKINSLKVCRKIRICEEDFKALQKECAKNKNEQSNYGVGSIWVPCFLNNKEIDVFEKCFEQKYINNNEMGLRR